MSSQVNTKVNLISNYSQTIDYIFLFNFHVFSKLRPQTLILHSSRVTYFMKHLHTYLKHNVTFIKVIIIIIHVGKYL